MQEPTPNELCYICAQPLALQERDVEHVVPQNLFNKGDRRNLIVLPAHKACNASYSKDDEYFRLCMTAAASQNEKARRLWSGPVVRGIHRAQSRRFKAYILDSLKPVEVHTEAGLYLGDAEVMLQEPKRIHRVVNRISRGLYSHLTRKVLPADWPVGSEMMRPDIVQFIQALEMRFFDVGNGTFLYGWKHLPDDDREALFWLVFFRSVHFWGYAGTGIRPLFPWSTLPLPG